MDPKPLDLRDHLVTLRARKWAIIAIAVTTTAVALVYSVRQTPVYTSSAEVIVLPESFNSSDSLVVSTPLNMTKEVEVANSAAVIRQASTRLAERDITPGIMSASEVEFAESLVFSAISPDPRAAQATAQAHATAYLDLRRSTLIRELEEAREPYESRIDLITARLEEIEGDLQTAQEGEAALLSAEYSIKLTERASYVTKLDDLALPESIEGGRVLRSAEPATPSGPNHTRAGLLGLLVGLALGVGIALFRDRMEEPVRRREELESQTGAPVLGFIPSAGWERSLGHGRLTPEADEAYKALRVRLVHIANQPDARRIVITSSFGGEGKTSVTSNLGMALALAGRRVVIVSADLRRPQLQTHFRGSDGEGLTEVLTGRRRSSDVLSTTIAENLWILHAGRRSESLDPSEALGSETMRGLLEDLRDFADFVLIDTPPLLTSSDVVALAPLTDGVLFVVDPRLAKRSSVEQARQELQLIDVPMLGVVVNKYDPRQFRAYGFGYHYYYRQDGHPGSGAPPPRTLRAIPTDSGDEDTDQSPTDRGTGDLWRPS
jgi:capsular exopolysaccharide synthesis family protein